MPGTTEKPRHSKAEPKRVPHRTGVGKMFYLDPELAAAFDAFIAAQKIPPSQTAVFDVALKKFLESEGFWPPSKTSEG